MIKKISLFSIVGVGNTVVDLLVVNACIALSSVTPVAIPYTVSRSLGFIAALIVSYVLNQRYVFVDRDADRYAPLRFAVVTMTTFLISVGSSVASFKVLGLYAGVHVAGTLAALVGSVLGAGINFLGYNVFVFRSAKVSTTVSFIRSH